MLKGRIDYELRLFIKYFFFVIDYNLLFYLFEEKKIVCFYFDFWYLKYVEE